MHFDMFVEIGFLSEAEVALRHWALVRAFISVDTKVVEEVVPLAEVLSTVVLITLQNLYVAFRLRVLEAENSELLCCRDVLLYLDRSEIKGLSCLYKNSNIFR